MRLVRLEPGSSSDPAFDSSRHPYSSAASPEPRLRAVYTRTGVRKATEVSRLSVAVTTPTRTTTPPNSTTPLRPARAS